MAARMLAAAVLFTHSAFAQCTPPSYVPAKAVIQTEGVYATIAGQAQNYYLLRPAAAIGRIPWLMMIHGGGLWEGDASQQVSTSQLLSYINNVAVIDINYPLTSRSLPAANPYPVAIQSVRCALRFVQANAVALGVQPEHGIVMGRSAGGYLASQVAVLPDQQSQFDSSDCTWTAPIMLTGVVSLYGAYDYQVPGIGALQPHYVFQTTQWLHDLPTIQDASPARWLNPGTVPFFIARGVQDTVIPDSQQVAMVQDLTAAGVPFQAWEVPGFGHNFSPLAGAWTPALLPVECAMLGFIASTTGAIPNYKATLHR